MYPNSFTDPIYQSKEFKALTTEIKKFGLDLNLMKKNNPERILRNYFVEEAIEDYEKHKTLDKVNKLLDAISSAYTKNKNIKQYQQPPSKDFDINYKTHCNT
jgi:uncharacterized protein YdiU (UPF0061 family)